MEGKPLLSTPDKEAGGPGLSYGANRRSIAGGAGMGASGSSTASTPRSLVHPIPIMRGSSQQNMFPDTPRWDSFSFRRFGGASGSHRASIVAPQWHDKTAILDEDDNASELDAWGTVKSVEPPLGLGLGLGGSSLGPADDVMSVGIQESIGPSASRPASVVPEEEELSFAAAAFRASLFGVVNCIIILPVMIGFSQIIFRDHFFDPYRDELTKLVLFSSIIHQLSFTCISTLPFAIGQVQDAGLIFLSAMSTSIVKICQKKGASDDEILATTLCWLAISTACLGIALYITGKLKLAALVQYLPMPVVGGYLAFIGLYCGEAGMALMTGETVAGPGDWAKLGKKENLILLTPGLLLGITLFVVTSRFRHFAVLPSCLLVIPISFYVILAIGHWNLDDARQSYGYGWVANATTTPPFYEGWKLYNFPIVHWDAIPPQIGTWLAMYFVVAFSSSLDVAAIQMELGRPLNFNHELSTVGLSNLFSGLTGGFTGSYIFSQTIFTMRSGLHTRMVGNVLNVIMIASFFAPISFLSYIPRFFFGSVMSLIAIDLMLEWLWHSRHLVFPVEYAIVLATFVLILLTNLEVGMLLGIALSVLAFAIQYARSKQTKRLRSSSNVVRGFSDRAYLSRMKSSIVSFELHGHVFFGSAIQILKEIQEHIFVEKIFSAAESDSGKSEAAMPKHSALTTTTLSTRQGFVRNQNGLFQLSSGIQPEDAPEKATKFLVIDFRKVVGLDATAARSLFAPLAQLVKLYQLEFVATAVSGDMERLLASHGVHFRLMDTLDEGVEWCEERLLQSRLQHKTASSTDCEPILDSIVSLLESASIGDTTLTDHRKEFDSYFNERKYGPDETIFRQGSASDSVYFVMSGRVTVVKEVVEVASSTIEGRRRLKEIISRMIFPHAGKQSIAAHRRLMQYNEGGVFGDLDFFVGQKRSFTAKAQCDCIVMELTRAKLREMYATHPKLGVGLQHLILRGMTISCASLLSTIADQTS
eukprot:m.28074 g.28074  ORF g.28074 m.28074 type:complete len:986 (+) comp7970_c0_seq1:124-3081(+)